MISRYLKVKVLNRKVRDALTYALESSSEKFRGVNTLKEVTRRLEERLGSERYLGVVSIVSGEGLVLRSLRRGFDYAEDGLEYYPIEDCGLTQGNDVFDVVSVTHPKCRAEQIREVKKENAKRIFGYQSLANRDGKIVRLTEIKKPPRKNTIKPKNLLPEDDFEVDPEHSQE